MFKVFWKKLYKKSKNQGLISHSRNPWQKVETAIRRRIWSGKSKIFRFSNYCSYFREKSLCRTLTNCFHGNFWNHWHDFPLIEIFSLRHFDKIVSKLRLFYFYHAVLSWDISWLSLRFIISAPECKNDAIHWKTHIWCRNYSGQNV